MLNNAKSLVGVVLWLLCAWATPWGAVAEPEAALIHPIFNKIFTCTEHYAGQLGSVGDALGTDCHIQVLEEVNGRAWLRSYRGEGEANEDWYGWQQDVLAPTSGEVVKVNINPTVNAPGRMGEGAASFVVIAGEGGLMALVAHVDAVAVKVGDQVTAGQVIAKVGNNGQSRHPHIHVGVWRGDVPLQVRFDQVALAAGYQSKP